MAHNRVATAPMVKNIASPEGYVTPRTIANYKTLAEGEWGIIVIEATRVHPSGSQFRQMLGMWSDKHVLGNAELVDASLKPPTIFTPRTSCGCFMITSRVIAYHI